MSKCDGCFAKGFTGNSCGVLLEIPRGKCRFYKTRKEIDEAREKSIKRLIEIGREDLIQRYTNLHGV